MILTTERRKADDHEYLPYVRIQFDEKGKMMTGSLLICSFGLVSNGRVCLSLLLFQFHITILSKSQFSDIKFMANTKHKYKHTAFAPTATKAADRDSPPS